MDPRQRILSGPQELAMNATVASCSRTSNSR